MAKITMPFFQATSTKLPLTKEVVNVNKTNLPSAGPYYMTRNDPDQLTQIRQNPNYKTGPGRTRPRNLAGLDVRGTSTSRRRSTRRSRTSSTRSGHAGG